jgi:uncharacterized Zn finger protein
VPADSGPSAGRPPRKGGERATDPGLSGGSWWSARFVDVLESFALGNRLARGRTAAKRGAVGALTVAPGLVTARVRGDRAEPYVARLALRPCPEIVWARVEIALAEQALFTARLLSGELPSDLEEVFADAGSSLFPRSAADLRMECDCTDWEMPCLHLAAVVFELAGRLDSDPFILLRWRGRDREALLTRLRVLRSDLGGADLSAGDQQPRSGARATAPTGVGRVIGVATTAALTDLGVGEDEPSYERFWLPPVPLPARPAVLPVPTGALLRQLPEPGPELGGPELLRTLTRAYESFAAARR